MRWLAALLLTLTAAMAVETPPSLPVLHQGRVKPFSVAAEECLLAVSGTSRLAEWPDAASAFSAILADQGGDRALIYVPWLALRAELKLEGDSQRATFAQVAAIAPGLDAVARRKQDADQRGLRIPWTPDDQARLTLSQRYGEALEVCAGRTLFLTPLAVNDEERRWVLTTVGPKVVSAGASDRPWRNAVAEIMAAPVDQRAARLKDKDLWLTWEDVVRDPDPLLADAPRTLAEVLSNPLRDYPLSSRGMMRDADLGREAWPSRELRHAELAYQRAHPFTIAWIGFILGGLAIATGWKRTGYTATGLAVACTVAGLTVRVLISGLGAVTNLYETLIYVALIAAALGLWLAHRTGRGSYAAAGGIAAGLCAMVGEAMPPDLGRHIGQLQPVLRSKFWLWIHVKVVVAAYAPLVLALVLGNATLWRAWRAKRPVAADEAQALYRCLQWGTVLMAAGTLLGAVWADQAWGRFWGWDPKEVGALMICLTYLVPLHLRYVGGVSPTAMAAWSVLGFLSVVWSWYGVNFILGAGLHAYAFGSGGQGIVLPLAAAQIVLTVWQCWAIRSYGK